MSLLNEKTNFGLKVSEALSKSLEITKKDAERCESEEEKTKVYDVRHICMMADYYVNYDIDIYSKRIHSIESNYKRLENDITFILKTWLIEKNEPTENLKTHSNEISSRFIRLLLKYEVPHESKNECIFHVIFSSVPDICCNFLLKNKNLSENHYLGAESYDNFNNEYKYIFYFAMLPNGTKYGGFVKAIIDLYFISQRKNIAFLFNPDSSLWHSLLSIFRSHYNSNIISQEKRLEFFEKLQLNEDDCKLWSVTFDLKYPEMTYIHKLFGQIS